MNDSPRFFALYSPNVDEVRSLVRFRGDRGELWQPETREWIQADWMSPLLYRTFPHIVEVSEDQVERILAQRTLMQLGPSAREYLRKQPGPRPPVNETVYEAQGNEAPDLNERSRAVQSWWVASELVRRHPGLIILEVHSHGGTRDELYVASHSAECKSLLRLNRHGTLRLPGADHATMDWAIERSLSDRHQAVKELEEAAGLPAPSHAPSSAPKALTYRVITRILASLVNERQTWDARSGFWDSTAWVPERRDMSAFPSAVHAGEEHRPDDPYGESYYRFWILQRGHKQVVVLDTDGMAHLRSGEVRDLSTAYAVAGRRLTATIGSALGDLLP